MVENTSVSVVVPVYDVAAYLPRCLDSMLRQTVQDYEIVLVDDGSRDSSGGICDDYARRYERISAFHKENGGLSSARNYGVAMARGAWITFVDPDDYVSETYLADLLHLVEQFDADMAMTSVDRCSEEEAPLHRDARFADYCLGPKEAFREAYTGGIVNWSGCGKLIRREVLRQYPFPDGYYEDSASAYLHIFACERVAIGDYPNNYKYIQRQGSITASALQEQHLHIFEVCGDISGYIQAHCPELQYVAVLVYQNAVLQLLTRIQMPWSSYREIYLKYRKLFRKNCMSILARRDVRPASKYYILMLSGTPFLFRFQNLILKLLRGQL